MVKNVWLKYFVNFSGLNGLQHIYPGSRIMHQNLVQTIQFDPVKGGGGQNSCKATEFATIQSAALAR